MRCRTCDYPLWNLPARQCPECGTAFLPSAYEFKVGFVRFNCPHCAQSYYGTDERGHLEPRGFDCVSCGRAVTMDEMVLLPSEGVQDEQTHLREPVPWLVREKIGFFRGWIKTVFAGMGAAGKLARSLPQDSRARQALWFAALTLIVSALVAATAFIGFFSLTGGFSAARAVSDMGTAALVVTALRLASLLVWGVCVHGLLRLLGVSHARLGRTFQYLCYTCGPCVIVMIPCLGLYVFWIGDIWWIISAAVMLSVGYGVSGWKTTIATLVLPLLAVCGAIVAIFIGVNRTMNAVSSLAPPPNPASAAVVASAMRDQDLCRAGAAPTHGAALVVSGTIGVAELIAEGSESTDETVRIGTTALVDFLALDPDAQKKVADEASAALPAKVVAHRLGDVVFTYHGLDAKNPQHAVLWSFVMWPDPEANDAPPESVMIGQVDGRTFSLSASSMPTVLPIQNAQRSRAGLPRLPEPAAVTHDTPATSE